MSKGHKESLECKDLQRKFFVLVKPFKYFLKENYSSSESEEIVRSALIDLIMFTYIILKTLADNNVNLF